MLMGDESCGPSSLDTPPRLLRSRDRAHDLATVAEKLQASASCGIDDHPKTRALQRVGQLYDCGLVASGLGPQALPEKALRARPCSHFIHCPSPLRPLGLGTRRLNTLEHLCHRHIGLIPHTKSPDQRDNLVLVELIEREVAAVLRPLIVEVQHARVW